MKIIHEQAITYCHLFMLVLSLLLASNSAKAVDDILVERTHDHIQQQRKFEANFTNGILEITRLKSSNEIHLTGDDFFKLRKHYYRLYALAKTSREKAQIATKLLNVIPRYTNVKPVYISRVDTQHRPALFIEVETQYRKRPTRRKLVRLIAADDIRAVGKAIVALPKSDSVNAT